MAIEIYKRPFSYCFSGNPVHYELYSEQAAADPTIYFEVKVLFKPVGSDWVETPEFPFSPVNGYAEVDVKDILEGFLSFELPQFNPDEQLVWILNGHTGMFYIQFREITLQNNDPTWNTSEEDYACFVIKGGTSYFKYQGNNFWTNYFDADTPNRPRPFLTWQQSGRLAALTERMYLAYLLIDGAAEMLVVAKVYYVDGTNATFTKDVPAFQNKVHYIPAGAAQWGFDTTKQVYYWEISLNGPLGMVLSVPFRYYADNRNDYNDVTLHYRNSLGGLDSVRVRGVIETDLDYDYQELQKTVRPDYFNHHYFEAQKEINNNKELQTFRGDIGHLEKEEQDRLRDVYLKRETWWQKESKWRPVNIVTKNMKLRTTDSTRWNLPIDFTMAFDGDINYTPESVDLGSGVFTDNVCRAMVTPLTVAVDMSGANALATVSGTEIDPQNASEQFRYRLLEDNSPGTDWGFKSYSELPFDLSLPKEHVYTLEVQSICTNTVYGKKTTMQISTVTPPGGGGGGGGGGTTPANNSEVRNNTTNGTSYEIQKNNVHETSGYAGSYNTSSFYIGDADASITLVLGFSASSVSITSNGLQYYPDLVSGNTAIFNRVIINNGMIINIY